MKKQLLPPGTVVRIKKCSPKIMVCGFVLKDKNGNLYDYAGVIYPAGIDDPKNILLFNSDDIETVCYIGFQDDEQRAFGSALSQKWEEYSAEYLSLEENLI